MGLDLIVLPFALIGHLISPALKNLAQLGHLVAQHLDVDELVLGLMSVALDFLGIAKHLAARIEVVEIADPLARAGDGLALDQLPVDRRVQVDDLIPEINRPTVLLKAPAGFEDRVEPEDQMLDIEFDTMAIPTVDQTA